MTGPVRRAPWLLAALLALAGCTDAARAQQVAEEQPLDEASEVASAAVDDAPPVEPTVRAERAVEPEVGTAEAEPAIAGASAVTTLLGDVPLDEHGNPVLGQEIPIHDPSGWAMQPFLRALARAAAGEGQARVVVYGASHVASDSWTWVLRRTLQERFGDAGHGFILPAQPWRHYRHHDVSVESSQRLWTTRRHTISQREPGMYGLAGVAVETAQRGAWGRLDTGEHTASRFELWFLRQPEGGTLDVRIDDRHVRRVSTASAEASAGYELFTLPDAHHTFEVRARGDGPVTVFGVSVEREVPGVIVDALGINGARAAAQLMWDATLHAEHLRRRMPDLVALAYGTNESGDDDQPIETYETELRRVVARVRETVPTSSCLLIGPSDRPVVNRDGTFTERPRTAAIIEVQRRVATDYGCGFFDMVAFGGGPLHMVQWAAIDPAWAQDDYVHYTSRAYQRLGAVVSTALLDGYPGPFASLDAADDRTRATR